MRLILPLAAAVSFLIAGWALALVFIAAAII